MERMSEHVHEAKIVDKVKYRMAPLLPACLQLLETDPIEVQTSPFKRDTTNDLIHAIAKAAPAARQTTTWLDKRLEGKELMRLKNASLQELIAGGFGQTGSKLYAIAANHINQAVLGFTQTTTNFKKQQQLPRHISIPDILNMQGQVARCYARHAFKNVSATTCSA